MTTCSPPRPLVAPRTGSEHGSATVWLTVLLALLGVGTAVVLVVADATALRHRAAAAADLAALAGAERILAGADAACNRAATVARAHGAVLESCRAGGTEVEVVVALRGDGIPLVHLPARARARAGLTVVT
jgi:secretion/DNA translocation related TadE-like protein